MSFKPASDALSGTVVLDLTRARAGPTAARQFADWGADVIKIEVPGDPMYGDLGLRQESDFQNLHRNKRSLTLDLKSGDGLAVFMRLAAGADVIIENYRPAVKFRLGIDYESVKAVNSAIVYGSISGFGQDGPYADRPGLDQIAQGLGGHMMVTGEPGRGPMRSGAAISDMFAGLLCANAILTALIERQRSGEGQWVQTSLLEAQIFLLDFQAARWLMDGVVPGQAGNNHPTNIPMGVFATSDGHINIAPMASMWEKFCRAIGAAELVDYPDFATPEARLHNREAVNAAIEERTRKKTSNYWIETLNQAGVPAGPIHAMDETFADEQVRHLGIAQTVMSPALGPITLVGQPIHMSRSKSTLAAAPPECGEHSDEVLAEFGYSAAEVADFRRREII